MSANKEWKLDPEDIGRLVTVQVFDRLKLDSEDLVPNSLHKYVGRLRSFNYNKRLLILNLDGAEPIKVYAGNHYVEFYFSPVRHVPNHVGPNHVGEPWHFNYRSPEEQNRLHVERLIHAEKNSIHTRGLHG